MCYRSENVGVKGDIIATGLEVALSAQSLVARNGFRSGACRGNGNPSFQYVVK